jgi:hypothetical protein
VLKLEGMLCRLSWNARNSDPPLLFQFIRSSLVFSPVLFSFFWFINGSGVGVAVLTRDHRFFFRLHHWC